VRGARAAAGLPPLEPWTLHDLRRTCATGLGRLGVFRFIQDRVLNHVDRTIGGVYDRWEYLPEKRHALEAWGRHLESVTAPEPDAKVVPLVRH
jgi:integrase